MKVLLPCSGTTHFFCDGMQIGYMLHGRRDLHPCFLYRVEGSAELPYLPFGNHSSSGLRYSCLDAPALRIFQCSGRPLCTYVGWNASGVGTPCASPLQRNQLPTTWDPFFSLCPPVTSAPSLVRPSW